MRWLVRLPLVILGCSLFACGPIEPATRTYGEDFRLPPTRIVPVQSEHREPSLTFAVWARDALPARAVERAAALEGVRAVAALTTGTVRVATGAGTRTVSAASIDPEPLRYDPTFGTLAQALERGDAGINAAGAVFRGVRVGSALTVRGSSKAMSLRIGSMLPHDALFGHELVVPSNVARSFGLDARALVVAVAPERYVHASERLVDVAGEGARIRPLAAENEDENGLVISREELHRWFGSFAYVRGPGDSIVPDPRWVRAAIVDFKVPVIGWVRCHRNIVAQLWYAMHEIERAGLADRIEFYDGCYVPRFQRGDDTQLSAHAYGIAIDLNAATNGMGDDTPEIDPRIVTIMTKWGFRWGGTFRVPDGMHFEFERSVRAAS